MPRIASTRVTLLVVLFVCLLGAASLSPGALLAASSSETIRSGDPPDDGDDPIQFSGQIFANYQWNTTQTGPTENFNQFSFNRWYSTVRAELSEQLNFRGTTDAKLSDAGYSFIIKYAYVDWHIRPGLTMRAGIQQTGWQNYVNSVWGYRGIAKSMAQYQGHLSMADLGATLTAQLPDAWGEVSAGVLNGSGYRAAEGDQFKDLMGRVRLTPFRSGDGGLAPVEISGHGYYGTFPDGRDRHRWGALVGYNGDRLTLALNWDGRDAGAVSASGFSGIGTVQLGALPKVGVFSLVGLLDWYSIDAPASEGGDQEMIRSVAGLACEPIDGFVVALDYQQDWADANIFPRYDGTRTDADGSVFVHLIVNY